MGQAKARGSFEQRKAQAIQREEERNRALSERHRAEMRARLEREERQRINREKVMVATGGGMSGRSILATAALVAASMGGSARRAR